MRPESSDEADLRFLTMPGASVVCRLGTGQSRPTLEVFGNRTGLLSLANALLWFGAHDYHREFLSFGELSFVRGEGSLAVHMRITDSDLPPKDGHVRRLDKAQLLEWAMTDHAVVKVAVGIHRIVSDPLHEYDILDTAEDSEFLVHVRLTDLDKWRKVSPRQ